MNPPSQQVFLVNQQHPPVAPGRFVNPTIPDGILWGSNVRRHMGNFQILCGVIEVVLSSVCIGITGLSIFHMGIWTGVFAIVTGFLGVSSLKERCMVVAYMVTSIITAIMCGVCLGYAVFGTVVLGLYFAYGGVRGFLAFFIIMSIFFLILVVISIVGASYTCRALSSKTDQSQQVVNYTPQPLNQQYVPPPSYTVTVAQSGIISQTTTPITKSVFVSPII